MPVSRSFGDNPREKLIVVINNNLKFNITTSFFLYHLAINEFLSHVLFFSSDYKPKFHFEHQSLNAIRGVWVLRMKGTNGISCVYQMHCHLNNFTAKCYINGILFNSML